MKSRQIGSDYLLRFEKGELLIDNLLQFVKEKSIKAAWLQGLGAALWVEIGFYHLGSKEYTFNKIDKEVEISSLTGNIAKVDGQPFAHIHLVVSDENFQASGGHLKELAVGGTCEILLKAIDQDINRRLDDDIGLKLLDL